MNITFNCELKEEKSLELVSADIISLRQKKFRVRKSLSLMEIQRLRKNVRPGNAMLATNLMNNMSLSPNHYMDFERTMKLKNDYFCFVDKTDSEAQIEGKLAGMKVFGFIMLNAWRRRRDEVRRLTEEINKVRQSSIKTKNQIHVINSLFKVEQKTNDDLNTRLRRTTEEQQSMHNMYTELNKAFVELKLKYSESEKNLQIKTNDCENLNILLSDAKSEIFKAMAKERELEIALTEEQRQAMAVIQEKVALLEKIKQLETINREKEAEIQLGVVEKDFEISNLKNEIENLDKQLKYLKEKEHLLKEYEKSDVEQRRRIHDLTERLQDMQRYIDSTIVNRMKAILKTVPYQTLQYVHYFTFCLLPAIPPPKVNLDSQFSLQKAFSFMWS